MSNKTDDNFSRTKRIAQNTLFMYFRMLLLLLINLYASRVVLQQLGMEDFGIYGVVAGLVMLFTILSGSLTAAISRFLAYDLGAEDESRLKKSFSSAVCVQLLMAALVVFVAETFGLYYLKNVMVIPVERVDAAFWLYQVSTITFVVNLMNVPLNALIIAYERMSAFAYISIVEASGKLTIAFLLTVSPIDKLVFYGLMLLLIAISILTFYSVFCYRNFSVCRGRLAMDRSIVKEIASFAGWNFIGSASGLLRDYGGNLVINLFCGPIVNAARQISMQINGAVQNFVSNFLFALNPQITKSYAAEDNDYLMKLVFKGSRYCFFLITILGMPLIFCTPEILHLWLGVVPDHSVAFVRLVLILCLCESISGPLVTLMLATGKIRDYQLVVGGLQMLNLPVSYLFMYYGYPPETVLIVAIVISQLCLAARLYMLNGMVSLPVGRFVSEVYLTSIAVFTVGALVPLCTLSWAPEGFLRILTICSLCLICSALSILFIGCCKSERLFLCEKIYGRFKR